MEAESAAPFALYVLLGDNGGAHEPEPVLSVWTRREDAEREADRVRESEVRTHEERMAISGPLWKAGKRAPAVPDPHRRPEIVEWKANTPGGASNY